MTSRPAKKNKRTRPKSERYEMYGSTLAIPRPCGPIRIPSTISTTTVGSTRLRCRRAKMAPPNDAAKMMTSERTSGAVTPAGTDAELVVTKTACTTIYLLVRGRARGEAWLDRCSCGVGHCRHGAETVSWD